MAPKTSNPFPAPSELSDDQLLARLLDLQQRTRMTLMKYQIRPGAFSVMARSARRAISNTEELSELYELFINLQEFANEAKQRKVLDEAAMTSSGEQSSTGAAATSRRRTGKPAETVGAPEPVKSTPPPEPAAENPAGDGMVEIDAKTSADFFNNLDK